MRNYNQSYMSPRKLAREPGALKQREKFASVHKDNARDYESYNSSVLENPQTKNMKKVTYLYQPTRRLDRDVLKERAQLISHSAKVSLDTPDWFKSTFKHFKRSEGSRMNKSTIDPTKPLEGQKQFDVFNRKRDSYMTIQNSRMQSLYYNNRSDLYGSRPDSNMSGSTERSAFRIREHVTPKIGSVEHRDYTIKKPQLKIGANGYVDTYSVF